MDEHPARRRSPLAVIFLTVFVDLLGFGIVLPLLPYYAREFRASGMTIGALVAVYSAMQFLCAPVWGRWSDRIGRRPVILLSLAGSTLSYLLFGLANDIVTLFVSRILAGIAGANIPVAQAFIADTTTERERARGMGMIGAAFGLGFVFGPAIGGVMAHYNHHAPGMAAAVICGLNFLVAVWRLPESLPAERRGTSARVAARRVMPAGLALPLALFGAVVFSFSTMETTLSLLYASAYQLSAAQVSWLFGFMGLMSALMQGGLIGRLSKRVGESHLVLTGAVLLAAGLGAAPYAPPLTPLLVALAAIAFGQGMASPVLSSLLSKVGGGHERGSVLGVSQSIGSLARILGPLWGGFAFDHLGPSGPYLTTAMLMLVAAGAALGLTQPNAVAEVPAGS